MFYPLLRWSLVQLSLCTLLACASTPHHEPAPAPPDDDDDAQDDDDEEEDEELDSDDEDPPLSPPEHDAGPSIPPSCELVSADGPVCVVSATCTEKCTDPRCGDGIVSPGEACDDGNSSPFDSCAACKQVKAGFYESLAADSLAVAPAGDFYTHSQNALSHYDASGNKLWTIALPDARRLAANDDGVVAVGDGSGEYPCSVSRFDTSGEDLGAAAQVGPAKCMGGTPLVASSGHIFVLGDEGWTAAVDPHGVPLPSGVDLTVNFKLRDLRVLAGEAFEVVGYQYDPHDLGTPWGRVRRVHMEISSPCEDVACPGLHAVSDEESYVPSDAENVVDMTFGGHGGIILGWDPDFTAEEYDDYPWQVTEVRPFPEDDPWEGPYTESRESGLSALQALTDDKVLVMAPNDKGTWLLEINRAGAELRALFVPGKFIQQAYARSDGLLLVVDADGVGALDFYALASARKLTADWAACTYDRDCKSGLCGQADLSGNVCLPVEAPVTAKCTDSTQCASGLCVSMQCVETDLPSGTSCVDHRQCQSQLCRGDCVENVLEPGEHCTLAVQCQSGICNDELCI